MFLMSSIRTVPSNGITLAYEAIGDALDVPVLLVMGLGGQMLAWDDGFCTMLADRGHRVIRFDNRDIGLSTHLDDAASGRPVSAFLGRRPGYLIADMAEDAAGLIDRLGLGSVHVVGVSMGGCISQSLTLAHPGLVRSLTSISSSTGSRRVGHPRLDVAAKLLLRKPAANRAEAIALSVSMFRRIGSPGYPFDIDRVRRISGRAYDRRYDPAGGKRQFAAILGSPDRTAALSGVAVPTVVLHGRADPLIGVSGGAATAGAIPGARLVTFPGMGHDLPEPLWPRFVDEITENVRIGEARRASAR
jgi:pimeloyl-ACP methyl ester carboxylesterase